MTLSDLSAAADNAVLKDIIVGRIAEEGPLSFRDFMELALYHPVHGYYAACDPTRDYQSSPEVHAVFGAVLGRQLADFWRLLGRPARFDVFEAGAGSGRLAGDILAWLRAQEPNLYDALGVDMGSGLWEQIGHNRARNGPRIWLDAFWNPW